VPCCAVLQTLSILIQNVRNQQTVYYLFSNDHVNNIVSMRFDFEDDEVLVGVGGGMGWVRSVCAHVFVCHAEILHLGDCVYRGLGAFMSFEGGSWCACV
jgi:hypothetical protein